METCGSSWLFHGFPHWPWPTWDTLHGKNIYRFSNLPNWSDGTIESWLRIPSYIYLKLCFYPLVDHQSPHVYMFFWAFQPFADDGFGHLNWRYLLYRAHLRALCKGIYPQKVFLYMEVSPNSSIWRGFSVLNHPAIGVPPFLEPPTVMSMYELSLVVSMGSQPFYQWDFC